ncbi:MAG TPA: HlyD family efflux transporter periplasmic adaptor subunit [Polyangiales bacterium]
MSAPASIFRDEAVAHHARRGVQGDVLHLTPGAFFWVHRVLVGMALAAVVFACVGQIDEYATGPAVVRVQGRTEVTAPSGEVVEQVAVSPGDRVQAGDVLLRFAASVESSELQTVEDELADRLAAVLRDPVDAAAREAVASLRSRRDLARARVARKVLCAPHAGVVGDVRIRAGQLVEPGMPVVTLLAEHADAEVTALLPGQYLPLLVSGQKLRLTLDGFERDVQSLRIERVGDQIIGPNEAARFLGRELGDAFPLQGPVVLVHARLAAPTFRSGQRDYRFYHGMHGRAEAAVRTQSVLRSLLPSLSGALFDVL